MSISVPPLRMLCSMMRNQVFPDLGYDPAALQQAYDDLSLEPRPGGVGDMQTYYEVVGPGR